MLPEYICNCFEVTGFDTKEASCLRQDLNMKYDITSMPFEFPLGHRILIQKFISNAPNAPESIVPEATSCHSEILSATPASPLEPSQTVSQNHSEQSISQSQSLTSSANQVF